MNHRNVLTAALVAALLAAPALAQAPARATEALIDICSVSAKEGTPLADLAAASGAKEVKSPLGSEYKRDGYPDKMFSWADAPQTFVFILTSRFTNVPPKCTILLRQLKPEQAKAMVPIVEALAPSFEGGIDISGVDHRSMFVIDETKTFGKNAFSADLTLDKHNKHGEFMLISISRSIFYKPPASAAAAPAQLAPQ